MVVGLDNSGKTCTSRALVGGKGSGSTAYYLQLLLEGFKYSSTSQLARLRKHTVKVIFDLVMGEKKS